MEEQLIKKHEKLKDVISKLSNVIVAFSGGIDSALVLKVAYDVLKDNATAATADTPSLPRKELEEARRIAEQIGARHLIISTSETQNEDYLKNHKDRCYYCKSELYQKLNKLAKSLGRDYIINGTNFDDLSDYRPGLKAANENNVTSPLKDAELTKKDVRELAKHLGLEIWDKPSSPCLSSRVPYGMEITLKKLSMIEMAETFLKENFMLKDLRVRHFENRARIEINLSDFELINENLNLIKAKFKSFGFDEIELKEFKSGSMNLLVLQ